MFYCQQSIKQDPLQMPNTKHLFLLPHLLYRLLSPAIADGYKSVTIIPLLYLYAYI